MSKTECSCPTCGKWYAAEDIDRMVREIDAAMNGDKAAAQAKFCDIFGQVIQRVTDNFALSQAGGVGARYGVSSGEVADTRAWFTDPDEAVGWSSADDTVWDLVTGKVYLAAAA